MKTDDFPDYLRKIPSERVEKLTEELRVKR